MNTFYIFMVHINNKTNQDVIFKWIIKPNSSGIQKCRDSIQEIEVKAGKKDIVQIKLFCQGVQKLSQNKIKTLLTLGAVTALGKRNVLLNGYSELSLAYNNAEINLSMPGILLYFDYKDFNGKFSNQLKNANFKQHRIHILLY